MVKGYAGQITSVDVDQAERRLDAETDDPQGDFLKGFKLALSIGLVASILAAVFLVAKVAGFTFNDGEDAVLTSKLVLEAEARLRLSHPICVATMKTSVAGLVDHDGCYSPKARK